MTKFNEDSRVKIPSILHLVRLGYKYLSLKDSNNVWDISTNIFKDIFKKSILSINKGISEHDIEKFYGEISLCLENQDLGKAFYQKLVDRSGIKMIDFENFNNNTFNVITELTYKKDDEEFRPDITLLINGMPLVFIEVKKPNNKDGIKAEHNRIQSRFRNKKFRNFVNITQLMVFSNNMEYEDSSPEKIEGAFYATSSYDKPEFNYFREEQDLNINKLNEISDEIETFVLRDNNLLSIKNSPAFIVNKDVNTPTNRISSSLFSRERLAFILEFGLTYVNKEKGLEKHIMRYPQMFATKAIEKTIDRGNKKGIIWHTQGSGKTALAYYNVKYLSHYFQKKKIITKFYFIVDRLDLLIQSSIEFRSRGLVVHNIDSKDDFARDIKQTSAISNDSGKPEITVVNIQKFAEDPSVIKNIDYQVNVQRVFFLDEVHRSYNPKGSFLANLEQSDRASIKIGLTGTPLLGDDNNSKLLFGTYIHKYYYNASIKDGFTLRLIREEIETSYRLTLQRALEEIEVLKGNVNKNLAYAHPKFVEPMLDYIVKDFERSRISMNNNEIGAMVVCDSSDQAKMMHEIFEKNYTKKINISENTFGERKVNSAALILHDVGTKDDRKNLVKSFKKGEIDLLFVYNMLLTGFDSPRLKKLYLGRVIKAHNLLQTLTRVNRTYKNFKYGYVVDFADIEKEFEKTNADYLKELQNELGDEINNYSNLFKSTEEINKEITEINNILFEFNTTNAEIFSKQISEIHSRSEILKITQALNNAKNLYNLIRLSGNYEMLEKLDFHQFKILSKLADSRLALINMKETLENSVDTSNLLNTALEEIIFAFKKISEEEMVIADELKDTLRKTREQLIDNFDPKDPEFISLKEELERLFQKKNLNEVSQNEMENNINALNKINAKARELERKNQLLKAKYDNDEKYARLHKRLMEKDPLTDNESKLFEALNGLKQNVDNQIQKNSKMLDNEEFVTKMIKRLVISEFKDKQNIPMTASSVSRVDGFLVKEYINELNGIAV